MYTAFVGENPKLKIKQSKGNDLKLKGWIWRAIKNIGLNWKFWKSWLDDSRSFRDQLEHSQHFKGSNLKKIEIVGQEWKSQKMKVQSEDNWEW